MAPNEFATLTDLVQGPVFLPGDADYDTERSGFQTFGQRRPKVVVAAVDADDVKAAIGFAAARDLPVAVLSTGHGVAAEVEGEVLITTGRMSDVRIDGERRTAWFAAGVRWGQVVEAAAEFGLAPLSGGAPHVGAVSYTLGGGLGHLSRSYGYTADHVRSIEVVTADGQLRRVTAESDPELFWALRGAGGNFGVVTGMEVDLMPVSHLYGGALYFDAHLIGDLLRAWQEWTRDVPDEMTSSVALVPFPDIPALPEPLRGRHVVHVRIAYAGDPAAGEELVEPLRAVGPRLIDSVREMPYREVGSICNDPSTRCRTSRTTRCCATSKTRRSRLCSTWSARTLRKGAWWRSATSAERCPGRSTTALDTGTRRTSSASTRRSTTPRSTRPASC
ncbi:FAD-binding oxidoreductase [Saccharopolyspora pogona]|uniref:FAD-binding oxidoreductase n=1 Tax=Saccharopolyspora pogona TaxID=333966 RepID=UPI00295B20DF|nr:FAD-dependent oxidoreductase [Saccharopolyspora pogona]